jgi:hypothetical protein
MRTPVAALHWAILASAPVFIGGIGENHVACAPGQLPAYKNNFTFIMFIDIMTLIS